MLKPSEKAVWVQPARNKILSNCIKYAVCGKTFQNKEVDSLEINVRDDRKIVEVWMSRAEKNNPVLHHQLNEVCAQYKPKKYTVAVFESGNGDLYQNTLNLLAYNKKRVAELAVQKGKSMPLPQ